MLIFTDRSTPLIIPYNYMVYMYTVHCTGVLFMVCTAYAVHVFCVQVQPHRCCVGSAVQMYSMQRTTYRLQIHILQTGSVMDLTVTWQHRDYF